MPSDASKELNVFGKDSAPPAEWSVMTPVATEVNDIEAQLHPPRPLGHLLSRWKPARRS